MSRQSRLTRLDDLELVSRSQRGDRDAMNTLLERHYDRLYSVCRSMCPNAADAADATQDALMGIVRGLGRFDGRSAFSTWSYRVATNACLDQLRKSKRRPAVSLDAGLDAASGDRGHSGGPMIAEPSVSSSTGAVEARVTVDGALDLLAEEFRVPVVLRDLADLDYAEIAEALGVPVGTVKSRIARGRQQLALALGNRADDLDVKDQRHTAGGNPTDGPDPSPQR